jgi:hypothetical protein
MPAIDQCEPEIIEALEKAGYLVTTRPYPIRTGYKMEYVFADLRLKHAASNREIIVVEVKCFASGRLRWSEFYGAVGQYIVYRNGLQLRRKKASVYIAVPSHIYNTFFQRILVQAALRDAKVQLIVVNVDTREIEQWIH